MRVAKGFAFALSLQLMAQTVDRSPSITYGSGVRGAYQPGTVSPYNPADSARIHDLIRAGQLLQIEVLDQVSQFQYDGGGALTVGNLTKILEAFGTTVQVCAYYWHFVDVVWLAMFITIYLIR